MIEKFFGNQSYIEDCEVCCQPILIRYQVEEGVIVYHDVQRADG